VRGLVKKKSKQKSVYYCGTWEELMDIVEKHKGYLYAPSDVAFELGVSRSYIYELEKRGKIRAYRMINDFLDVGEVPVWVRGIIKRNRDIVLIPRKEIDRIKKEMIGRAERTLKRFRGKAK
jgi:predicted site-specific integrase-resolvase